MQDSSSGVAANSISDGDRISAPRETGNVDDRPDQMTMIFSSNIVRTLGADMYSNLGKVFVEFIANAYDSDSLEVRIDLDFEAIDAERKRLRDRHKNQIAEKAKAAEAEQQSEKPDDDEAVVDAVATDFDVLLGTLGPEYTITIEDDGHGMSWGDIQQKFLSVNRQRRRGKSGRDTHLKTDGGRMVMGRKGVGKLAGFGAASQMVITSTIAGEDFETVATIDTTMIEPSEPISNLRIPVSYNKCDASKSGTKIVLAQLRSEALTERRETIEKTIRQRFFGIAHENFFIKINGDILEPEIPEYPFIYPEPLKVDDIKNGKMAEASFDTELIGEFSFNYYVGFRAKSMVGADQGARIYCNRRLAAGPSLFGLKSGLHNFHGTTYMDCMIEADFLDRGTVDMISTDRGDLKEGNEITVAFLEKVRSIMEAAVREHGKWRERKAKQVISEDPTARLLNDIIKHLPSKTRKPALRLMEIMARDYDVDSDEFREMAPTLIRSINSGEVLVKLSTQGINLKDIADLTEQLRELAEIERWDTLKLYRARRAAILKLVQLYEQSIKDWKKYQNEGQLHTLLKENPWLVRPEFSHYISSNEGMNTVVSRLASILKVDEYANVVDGDRSDPTRPDLVFLASEPSLDGPFIIKIVELKALEKGLRMEDWRQLEDYIGKTRMWCEANLDHNVSLQGMLIGSMPDADTKIYEEKSLLEKFRSSTPKDPIEIIGIADLIKRTRAAHIDAIRAIETEMVENGEEYSDLPSAPVKGV